VLELPTNSLEFLTKGQSFFASCAQTINAHTAWITASIGSPVFEVAAMLHASDCVPSDAQCNTGGDALHFVLTSESDFLNFLSAKKI
jgi:hypothetical protein